MSGDYRKSLEAAGATVHIFEEFGSYQGDWWAKVTYNGETGWVQGCYGSCSGCDSFEAEFGWEVTENIGDSIWDGGEFRPATEEDVNRFKARLAEFGKPYLEGLMNQQSAEKAASENLSWDADAAAMVDFIRKHA